MSMANGLYNSINDTNCVYVEYAVDSTKYNGNENGE
jgi:hypothetical protein